MRNLLRDEAAARSELLEVASYDIDLDLTGDDDFGTTTVVRFACSTPGASTFVELDGQPLQVTFNGHALPAQLTHGRIALPDLAADNELRVVARGRWSRTGEGLHRFTDPVDGQVYLWGQSFLDDAQRIFACFDQPDLKAVFRLAVTAPADWTVIGNGRGTRDGNRWTFAETARMSTYLFTVAAGPWHGVRRWHDGIELGVWCRQSLARHLEAEELLDITAQCFDSYHREFGIRYPFGDTYDQLWVPEFNHGAMENPGAVTFTENLLFRSRVTDGRRRERAEVIAHEMAHMWFGDLVTMQWWDDLWLNESFAELMGFHTTEAATRFDGSWTAFCTGRKAWGYSADQMPTTHPISGPVADTRSALQNFDGISYAKGASVLRQLMVLVGPETFFEGVRRYLGRHAFANTSLADFLGAVGEAAGRDLSSWADDWLRTPGVSTLRVSDGAVLQQPPADHPVLRDHRIAVGRYDRRSDGALVLRDRFDVEVSGATTEVAGLALDADLVLPNDGDWTFAKLRFDPRSLGTVLGHLRDLDAPLARALCWAGLWDAARDAELPAQRFVSAVLTGALVEVDPSVLDTLQSQARTAAGLWADAPELLVALADEAQWQARTVAPGSDLQLCWARAWVSASTDSDALRDLLDGGATPGVAVDTELRWHIVRRLAVLGGLDETELAAELQRDPTTAGERHADVARAARPDPGAKERAWRAAMHDETLSNHQSAALAQGFWQLGQVDLCRPFVERYFAEVRAMWDARSPQVAKTLAGRLFPHVVVDREVLDRTAALVADPSLPAGLRRVLLECGDGVERAVAARELSAGG